MNSHVRFVGKHLDFKLKAFHFDVVHNFHYKCKNSYNSEDWEDKDFRYTYFELLGHVSQCHEGNPYKILKYLNIF